MCSSYVLYHWEQPSYFHHSVVKVGVPAETLGQYQTGLKIFTAVLPNSWFTVKSNVKKSFNTSLLIEASFTSRHQLFSTSMKSNLIYFWSVLKVYLKTLKQYPFIKKLCYWRKLQSIKTRWWSPAKASELLLNIVNIFSDQRAYS